MKIDRLGNPINRASAHLVSITVRVQANDSELSGCLMARIGRAMALGRLMTYYLMKLSAKADLVKKY